MPKWRQCLSLCKHWYLSFKCTHFYNYTILLAISTDKMLLKLFYLMNILVHTSSSYHWYSTFDYYGTKFLLLCNPQKVQHFSGLRNKPVCEIAHVLHKQVNINCVLACALEVDDVSIACRQYKHSLRA